MKIPFKQLVVACIALVATSCAGGGATSLGSNTSHNSGKEAKYIFYFIGDGMAAPQVQLAEAALTSPLFQQNYLAQTNNQTKSSLNIKSLTTTGLATSNAKNRYITDSAAAGTALATGSKTDVGMISQTPEGEELKTIAEMAKERGMKVGIVSSVSIDHATPACFYSHNASRNNYADISDQLLTSGFDYFAGGSVKWDKRAQQDSTDKAAAYAAYRAKGEELGFTFVTTKAELDTIGECGRITPVIATLDMLANEQNTSDGSAMPYTIDLAKQSSVDNQISLAQFTQRGIDLLKGDDGFFMMVEGGKIDWACHANDAAAMVYEVVAFDEAIGVAMAFAAQHPDETLIVVTGDHDCGGLAIGFAGTGYGSAFDMLGGSKSSYFEFTKVFKEMIAKGYGFDKVFAYACDQFGFTDDVKDGSEGVITTTSELSNHEVATLRNAYNKSAKKMALDDSDKYHSSFGGYDPFTTTCTQIRNNKSGVDFTSYTHTAVPVMVFAQGANEEIFSGYYDNTDIAKRIMLAAGLE